MKDSLPIADCRLPIDSGEVAARCFSIVNRKSKIVNIRAFSLIEVLVVITLLSLIVLALMAVFNSAQTAFRASVTQTDVLGGGRATMDMISADLRQMAPSLGYSNSLVQFRPTFYYCNSNNPVNFYAGTNKYGIQPLVQSLAGSTQLRTNVLENLFILGRGNLNGQPTWSGTGYLVWPVATNALYSLYRFYITTNVAASPNPAALFNIFMSAIFTSAFTNNWSHLLDGVVDLRVRAYDPNGFWMTNGYPYGYTNVVKNAIFLPPAGGECGFYLFSNTLPASVEVELGVLEDRTLQRAATWPNGSLAQSNYLAGAAGKVHLFRQRVTIPNVDPSAYQ
ncbi:MAG: prepilin-type N-terminal cleavage/methylation domain-containing protein [Verrucomicrobiia bacterium]